MSDLPGGLTPLRAGPGPSAPGFAASPGDALRAARSLAALAEEDGWPPVLPGFAQSPAFVTDKVTHGYMPAYERILGQLPVTSTVQARVCEVGVFCGGSLATWQAMLPGALVVGVDQDETCAWPEGTVKIVCGQDDERLPGLLRDVKRPHWDETGYDLIVDDASHDGRLTRRTWELLWPLVKSGGFYVIEDWFVGLGHHPWEAWGDSMLRTAESFLPLLHEPDGDPDSIEYRYGMIIMHRKAA